LSTATSTARALDEVCAAAALGARPDLACVFFSPHHGDGAARIARTLSDRLGPKVLLGCIGEAVVGVGREVERSPALSLWLGAWDGTTGLAPVPLTPRPQPDVLGVSACTD